MLRSSPQCSITASMLLDVLLLLWNDVTVIGYQRCSLGRTFIPSTCGMQQHSKNDGSLEILHQSKPLRPLVLFGKDSASARKERMQCYQHRIVCADWSFFPLQTYSSQVLRKSEEDEWVSQHNNGFEQESAIGAKWGNSWSDNNGFSDRKNLNLVYVDDEIVVVNKPSGIMSVPGPRRQHCILDMVYNIFGDSSLHGKKRDDAMDQMVVHRLDRDTSGLVVYALSETSLKQLHEDFRCRKVKKQYIALVCGHVLADEGEICLPLSRDHLRPPFMRVETPTSRLESQKHLSTSEKANNLGYKRMIGTEAKASYTQFRVISRDLMVGKYPVTRIMLYPETGRTHQLRVHCAAIGHPIVADSIYGLNGEGSQHAGFTETEMDLIFGTGNMLKTSCGRPNMCLMEEITTVAKENDIKLCLHAQQLNIWHPTSRAPISLSAPPPF